MSRKFQLLDMILFPKLPKATCTVDGVITKPAADVMQLKQKQSKHLDISLVNGK